MINILLGDFNHGPAVHNTTWTAPFNYGLMNARGLISVNSVWCAQCTFCKDNPLTNGQDNLIIDHIYIPVTWLSRVVQVTVSDNVQPSDCDSLLYITIYTQTNNMQHRLTLPYTTSLYVSGDPTADSVQGNPMDSLVLQQLGCNYVLPCRYHRQCAIETHSRPVILMDELYLIGSMYIRSPKEMCLDHDLIFLPFAITDRSFTCLQIGLGKFLSKHIAEIN